MEDIKGDLPKPILIEDLGYLYPNEDSKQKRRFGLYECSLCGKHFKTYLSNVKRGLTLSCGCYHKKKMTKHGLHKSKLYEAWNNIKNRTLNPKYKRYGDYGGRGISICDEWKNDFMSFYNWAMSNGYSDELSIDRIDNNGNYCPENCRWTTQTIQTRNTRIPKNNTSGYKGVSFRKDRNKYSSHIYYNGRNFSLGLYSTPEDGAVAYNNYIITNDLEGFPLNKLPDSHIHLQLPTKPHHQTLE